MDHNPDTIKEIYSFLERLSKEIIKDRNKRHELLQEVIIQIINKESEYIEELKERNEIEPFCARIMNINYHRNNSS